MTKNIYAHCTLHKNTHAYTFTIINSDAYECDKRSHNTQACTHTLCRSVLSLSHLLPPSYLSVLSLLCSLFLPVCVPLSVCLPLSFTDNIYPVHLCKNWLCTCVHVHVICNCFLYCSWCAIVWAPRLTLANPGRAILTPGLELLLVVVARLSDCCIWTNF